MQRYSSRAPEYKYRPGDIRSGITNKYISQNVELITYSIYNTVNFVVTEHNI